MAVDLLAGIPVRDCASAKPWYERLLGSEPAFMPHDTEAVNRDADGNEIGFGGPPLETGAAEQP